MTETFRRPDTVLTDRCRLDGRGIDALLSENTRLAKTKLNTGLLKVLGLVSLEGRWGWDGACLETVSAIAHDPISYKGGVNLYGYAGCSPVNNNDPSGLRLKTRCCQGCANVIPAIILVMRALRMNGHCRQWFVDHGWRGDGDLGVPDRTIDCSTESPVGWIFPTWTSPGAPISVSTWSCNDYGVVALASLIIHELAHHYCTIFLGREDCALSAQDACNDELL